MGISKNTNPPNSPQIIPFPVENEPPKQSIYTDEKNFKRFYDEYHQLVKRRCLSILHNEEDAKDITNEVFAKVQKRMSDGKFIDHPKTYLSRMAENMIKDKIKEDSKERKELIELYDMAISESYNILNNIGDENRKEWETGIIDNGYEQVEAEIIIKGILDEQDKTTSKIYFYYYHDCLTLEQIGESVGLKKSAVQKRLKNFEKKVKEAIKGEIKK
ncbi:MAG: sigma-70 family RNA polymerase sigma factor [Treponema sp.]|jgi:RNA polymerase sigma-70 factor (ECF subfamily)|nr:sigma-70 family RNA polymerase sigma factor [Treponema sp.]